MDVKTYTLTLVGDTNVGKTRLAMKMADKQKDKDKEKVIVSKITKGGEYYQTIHNYKKNQTIKIDIYGTSGDKRYQKLTKYLYRDAQVIIIMYKYGNKDYKQNIAEYYEKIKQLSVEEPFIYIVTICPEPSKVEKFVSINPNNDEEEIRLKQFGISFKKKKKLIKC